MNETLFDLPVVTPAATRRSVSGRIKPFLKWPGGKTGELDQILAAAPPTMDRYFEPFVGGGAVYWSISADIPAFINDMSTDLIDLYRYGQTADEQLFDYLDTLADWWKELQTFTELSALALLEVFEDRSELDVTKFNLVVEDIVKSTIVDVMATVPAQWEDLSSDFERNVLKLVPRKVARMRKVEVQRNAHLPTQDIWANVEGAYKACAYTSLRTTYNIGRLAGNRSPRQAALFFYLREFTYAAMFRFNSKQEFNVPYGGISYNRKAFQTKIDHLRSDSVRERLERTVIDCRDFEEFLEEHQPGADSWMFLDPPYDSDFSSYDENHFLQSDHQRLADVMGSADCKLQLVIKATPAVLEIYNSDRWNILAFDKKYMWTIKERNDRNATHLMITNYDPPT